jgi:GntR family transcriptional regulator/MocR family aminotransferase
MASLLTSLSPDLPMLLDRAAGESLGSQLRRRLLDAIRSGALRTGVRLPSTRALAAQLGVSRPLVVDAYAQLAAEGYLALRQGARPVVAGINSAPALDAPEQPSADPIRYDLRPAMPDVGMFPRKAWARAIRTALNDLPASELGYGDPRGNLSLRRVVADYVGRVRGVIADPACIYITSGFAEGRALVCAAFHSRGIRHLAVEDPSYSDWGAVDKAGLVRLPIPVDAQGLDVDRLVASHAQAAFVTPAHQFPIGGVLSAERRQRLVRWLRERDAYALEDDYDAEFRYDQAPVGALQGLAPDRIIYAGTVSKTLAPALRLAWLVVPPALIETMNRELRRWSEGTPRIDQEALAEIIRSGVYDRHLRRMRRLYRERRDRLVACLAAALPQLEIEGVAAGLHVTLRLPDALDEGDVVEALRRRGVATEGLGRYSRTATGPRRLFLGYGRISESAIEPAVHALVEAIGVAAGRDPAPGPAESIALAGPEVRGL